MVKRFKLPKFPKPKSGALGWVKLDGPESERTWSLVSQLQDRSAAVIKMTPFIAAHETFLSVMSGIPAGPKWNRYRNSLRFVRFGSAKSESPIFGVYAVAKPLETREIDTVRSVLYVKPKKHFTDRVRPEIRVLARFSPWTSATLPFSPKKNEAVIIVRRVTMREVQHIARQREKDRPEWRKLLEAAGVRNINVTKEAPELKTKVVSDLYFDALRLEFGAGGAKAEPHWRPAIRDALNLVSRLVRHRSLFTKALTDPKDRAWRKWPPRAETAIKIESLKSISKFAKRLKVRV